jgi:hypothetical protein
MYLRYCNEIGFQALFILACGYVFLGVGCEKALPPPPNTSDIEHKLGARISKESSGVIRLLSVTSDETRVMRIRSMPSLVTNATPDSASPTHIFTALEMKYHYEVEFTRECYYCAERLEKGVPLYLTWEAKTDFGTHALAGERKRFPSRAVFLLWPERRKFQSQASYLLTRTRWFLLVEADFGVSEVK